jgi:hypothetical protein
MALTSSTSWPRQALPDEPSANLPEIQPFMGYKWLADNVTTGHGPPGALYPQKYVGEGGRCGLHC